MTNNVYATQRIEERVPTRDSSHLQDAGEDTCYKNPANLALCHLGGESGKPISYR
jgi:hypothetical protein